MTTNGFRAQIKQAFRKNLIPGLVLWGFGMLLIAGFFYVPGIRSIMDHLAALKETYGFLFSCVSMGLFAGLIPAIVALATGQIPQQRRFQDVVFFTAFWAYKGIEVDILYRIQAAIFGDGSDFATLTLKVLVDQLVYVPFIATVPLLVAYRWRDADFNMKRTIAAIKTKVFWSRLPLVIVSCWIVWIPAVYMIYWFPSSLQLAIANLIECFWVLMLLFLTASKHESSLESQAQES